MGKRSNFTLIPKGKYPTPLPALLPLIFHIEGQKLTFIEPCAGDGRLGLWLERRGHYCVGMFDTEPAELPDDMRAVFDCIKLVHKADARKLTKGDFSTCSYAITNPPWPLPRANGEPTLSIIRNMCRLGLRSWMLLSADFMHNAYAGPLMRRHCVEIISIGRVQWIAGTDRAGKENVCWYHFWPTKGAEVAPLIHLTR